MWVHMSLVPGVYLVEENEDLHFNGSVTILKHPNNTFKKISIYKVEPII